MITWHFSADIKMCKRPGGGWSVGGWNIGGGIASKCVLGLERGGGGKDNALKGCGGPNNEDGNDKVFPEAEILFSGTDMCCIPAATTEECSWLFEECCNFGFRGPRSCCTAVN